jgi:hypothetical protein
MALPEFKVALVMLCFCFQKNNHLNWILLLAKLELFAFLNLKYAFYV